MPSPKQRPSWKQFLISGLGLLAVWLVLGSISCAPAFQPYAEVALLLIFIGGISCWVASMCLFLAGRRNGARNVPRLISRGKLTLQEAPAMLARSQAMELELRQSWLPGLEAAFQPGTVRLLHSGAGELLVYAALADMDVFAERPEEAGHTRFWELGDVLEIFLQRERARDYHEMHINPHGDVQVLRWPSYEEFQEFSRRPEWPEGLENYRVVDALEVLRAEEQTNGAGDGRPGWQVFARVRLPGLEAGTRWRVSIARYDYTRGAAQPVLSATAPLPRRSFHLAEHWTLIELR